MPSFKPRDTERASKLRREATPMERKLWRYLSGSALGARFSRQMPVGPYFADFLCRGLMIVIELDSHSHDLRPGYDAARDRFMVDAGYRVLRFTNADMRNNVEGVATAIRVAVAAARAELRLPQKAHPQPFPQAGRRSAPHQPKRTTKSFFRLREGIPVVH